MASKPPRSSSPAVVSSSASEDSARATTATSLDLAARDAAVRESIDSNPYGLTAEQEQDRKEALQLLEDVKSGEVTKGISDPSMAREVINATHKEIASKLHADTTVPGGRYLKKVGDQMFWVDANDRVIGKEGEVEWATRQPQADTSTSNESPFRPTSGGGTPPTDDSAQ